MHESKVVADLVDKIREIADEHEVDRVDAVSIQLGAMSHLTPEVLRGQFEVLAAGTVAEHARLDISRADDPYCESARDVRLVSVAAAGRS